MERSIILLVLWTYLGAAFAASLPSDPYYYGGVVEMPFAVSGTPEQRLNENLANYLSVLGEETAALSDILIFPESTLNSVEVPTFVPDPKQQIAPCDFADSLSSTPYQSFLVQLSCAARRIATYVVINLTEKENCTTSSLDPRPCASDGLNIFNTNVVFDRNGTVISRYRKVNLYEEAKNVTYVPDIAWFDTDFGVRFGHFVCFDILFYTPAEVLVKKYGITDFIMPTMWFSQMPFLTAIQIQQAWAYGNNVKLLVAGATLPSIGSTGSGIYNGRQGYVTAMLSLNEPLLGVNVAQIPKTQNKNQNLEAKLYKQFIRTTNNSAIAEIVTKINHTAAESVNQDNIYLKRDFLELYETMPIDLNQGRHFEQTLCFNKTDFCCHFELDWTTIQFLPSDKNHYYTYRLGIYDGWRKEEKADTNKLRNCAIFSCIGDQLADCGKVFPAMEEGNIRSAHEFKRVAITGLFPVSTEYLLMPNTLQDDLMPLFVGDIEWTDNEVRTQDGPKRNVSLVSKRYMDNLLTFAIYGNYYNGTDLRNSASLSVAHMGVLLLTVLTALAY